MGAPKRAFRARRPPIFTFCSVTSDIFLDFLAEPLNFTTAKSMFPARLLSIFSTCHKMPRLPQNLHLVATWRSPANAICKKHATLKLCIQWSQSRSKWSFNLIHHAFTKARLVLHDEQAFLDLGHWDVVRSKFEFKLKACMWLLNPLSSGWSWGHWSPARAGSVGGLCRAQCCGNQGGCKKGMGSLRQLLVMRTV